MTVAFCSAICVCARILPFMVALVSRVTAVLQSRMPSKCELAPKLAVPATCQKTFFASAPPLSVTCFAAVRLRFPVEEFSPTYDQ